jgi:hypothetical protein
LKICKAGIRRFAGTSLAGRARQARANIWNLLIWDAGQYFLSPFYFKSLQKLPGKNDQKPKTQKERR